jgi:hypothetical protein
MCFYLDERLVKAVPSVKLVLVAIPPSKRRPRLSSCPPAPPEQPYRTGASTAGELTVTLTVASDFPEGTS